MAKIDGGEMMVRALEREGVHEIFTLHGGHLDSIYAAAARHDFRVIDTRHEQAAAHMADGWARTTGRPGVAIVTAGPGVTDAVTGVANAFMDSIPMVLIGGRSPLADDDKLPLQAVDQMGILRPITKWARSVTHTERIPEFVAAAFRHAISGRPGPVFLELPIDVLFRRAEESEIPFPETLSSEDAARAEPRGLAASAQLAARGQASRDPCRRRCVVFAVDRSDPARGTCTYSRDDQRESARHHLRRTSAEFRRLRRDSSRGASQGGGGSADLVIMLGTRIGMFTGGRNSVIPADARVIQVDIEPEEIGRNRDIQLGIVSDCREFIRDAIDALQGEKIDPHQEWIERLTAIREAGRHRYDDAIANHKGPIHPARLTHDIAKALDHDAIVVADGGETAAWMGSAWTARSSGPLPHPRLPRMPGSRTSLRFGGQGGASR